MAFIFAILMVDGRGRECVAQCSRSGCQREALRTQKGKGRGELCDKTPTCDLYFAHMPYAICHMRCFRYQAAYTPHTHTHTHTHTRTHQKALKRPKGARSKAGDQREAKRKQARGHDLSFLLLFLFSFVCGCRTLPLSPVSKVSK